MQGEELGKKITRGLVWTYLERVSAQGVSTLVTIILARLLLPEDYGVVSIATIFMSVCDALVVGGFSDTLIQKKDADDVDFSTMFWFVLAFGFLMYGIVFAVAPLAQTFFKTSMVCVTLRVMAVRLPINAVKSIQSAYISKHMKYKYFFFATLIGTVVSAVVGIVMAYMGFGVWALVAQYLTNSVVDTLIIWFTCGWHPSFKFDLKRLKSLYSFGWKMQLSTLLATIYAEVESLCIGRKYTSADLAYYEKGRQFPRMIMHNIQTSISKVMLPAFSKISDEKSTSKKLAKKSISISTYLMAPLLIGLILCSKEFVTVVLTEKWLPAVPFMQLLSVYYLIEPMMAFNKQIVIAAGESALYLKMEILKKSIGISLLLISVFCFDSVYVIAVATVLTQIIGLIIQSAPLKRIINYSLTEQVKDVAPSYILAICMAIPICAIKMLDVSSLLKLIFEVAAGAALYLIGSMILKLEPYKYCIGKLTVLKGKIKK